MSWNTHIPKFRRFVLQNFPFIEQDFDALTDYELICKVVEYLNSVITSQNGVIAEVERFETDVNNEINTFETNITNNFNRLEGLFNELKSYVDNYFENLDVQEEINNKLDDMVESGTLQEIINQYINSTALWMFDTVGDMKLATNFVNGSFAKTLGFYSRNDEGGATYKIRTKTVDDTADGMTLIDLYDNSLIAELVKSNIMNVRQFGAKGDGFADDTTKIQKAIDFNENIKVPSGTYMVNAVTHINLNSGNRLELDKDATIKAIANDQTSYAVLLVDDVVNVEISGGTIEGERSSHSGVDGEWGHCIRLLDSSDQIYIHDINLKNAWGDGLCCKITGSAFTQRVHVDNVRRNGYSIVSAKEFVSTDDIIENTNGTNPQAGVDIEPDTTTNLLSKITFNNLFTKSNTGTGLAIAIGKALEEKVEVYVSNHRDDGSRIGESCSKHKDLVGNIVIKDSYLENSKEAGFRLWRCFDGDCVVKLIRPYIYNCNTNSVGTLYGSGITGYILSTDTNDDTIGNIEIVEPYIYNYDSSISNAINFTHQGSVDPAFNNIKIINPIYIQGKHIYFGDRVTNLTFTDLYGLATTSSNSDYTLQNGQYYSLYTNTSSTSTYKTVTIPDTAWVGRKIRVRNMNSNYKYSVKLPTTDYCYQLSDTVSPKVGLMKLGDTIELEKVSATEWIVTEINCTPTVS